MRAARAAARAAAAGDHDPARRLRGRAGRDARPRRRVGRRHGLREGEDYVVGTMIELPRACFIADRLAATRSSSPSGPTTSRRRRSASRATTSRPASCRPTSSAGSSTARRSRRSTWRASARWSSSPCGRPRRREDIELGVCGEHGGDPDSIAFFDARAWTTSPARPTGCRSRAWRRRRRRWMNIEIASSAACGELRRRSAARRRMPTARGARALERVPGTHPRPRRPGRRHRRRAALGRRLHEGRHAQAFPSFGSERTGAPVVAFCRIDDAPIRTREPIVAAGRARSSRTRRCCTRSTSSAAARRLRAHQHRRATSSSASRAARARADALPCRRPSSRASISAARCRTPRCSARSPPSPACVVARRGRARDPRALRRRRRRRQRRRRRCAAATTVGAPPMLRQIEGSRAVAETVALCRPEVICAYPISPQTHIVEGLSRAREDRRARRPASSSTSSPSSPRCRCASARRRPARAPTPRPRARACSTWPRRSTTPPASACRS